MHLRFSGNNVKQCPYPLQKALTTITSLVRLKATHHPSLSSLEFLTRPEPWVQVTLSRPTSTMNGCMVSRPGTNIRIIELFEYLSADRHSNIAFYSIRIFVNNEYQYSCSNIQMDGEKWNCVYLRSTPWKRNTKHKQEQPESYKITHRKTHWNCRCQLQKW